MKNVIVKKIMMAALAGTLCFGTAVAAYAAPMGGERGGKMEQRMDGGRPADEMNDERPELPEGVEEGERPELPEGVEEGERPELPEGVEEGERPELPEGVEEGERPELPEGVAGNRPHDMENAGDASDTADNEDQSTWNGSTMRNRLGSGDSQDVAASDAAVSADSENNTTSGWQKVVKWFKNLFKK